MRSTTCCSVGVRLAQPWRGRFRSPRARRAYAAAACQSRFCPSVFACSASASSRLSVASWRATSTRCLFELEAPSVVEFVAEALAGGEEPQALGPAFGAGGGGGEAFEGVDGDEPEVVLDGDLEGGVPGVFVAGGGGGDGGERLLGRVDRRVRGRARRPMRCRSLRRRSPRDRPATSLRWSSAMACRRRQARCRRCFPVPSSRSSRCWALSATTARPGFLRCMSSGAVDGELATPARHGRAGRRPRSG